MVIVRVMTGKQSQGLNQGLDIKIKKKRLGLEIMVEIWIKKLNII